MVTNDIMDHHFCTTSHPGVSRPLCGIGSAYLEVSFHFLFLPHREGHFEIPKTWFNDGTMKRITAAIANTIMRMLSL
jgi:hypothetical protein